MRYKEFAKRLAQLRKERGISARKMSLTIEKIPDFIYNIENGDELPLITDFFAICDYLGITPIEFFSFKNEHVKVKEPELINILTEVQKILLEINREIKKGFALNQWLQ